MFYMRHIFLYFTAAFHILISQPEIKPVSHNNDQLRRAIRRAVSCEIRHLPHLRLAVFRYIRFPRRVPALQAAELVLVCKADK